MYRTSYRKYDDSENFKMITEMLANQISYELHVYREKF